MRNWLSVEFQFALLRHRKVMKKFFFAFLLLLPFVAEAVVVPDCWSNFAHRRIKQGSYLLNFHTVELDPQTLNELLAKVEHINHMSASQPYNRLWRDGSKCLTVQLSPTHVTHYASIRKEVESALGQFTTHSGVSIDCVTRPR